MELSLYQVVTWFLAREHWVYALAVVVMLFSVTFMYQYAHLLSHINDEIHERRKLYNTRVFAEMHTVLENILFVSYTRVQSVAGIDAKASLLAKLALSDALNSVRPKLEACLRENGFYEMTDEQRLKYIDEKGKAMYGLIMSKVLLYMQIINTVATPTTATRYSEAEAVEAFGKLINYAIEEKTVMKRDVALIQIMHTPFIVRFVLKFSKNIKVK